MSDTTKMPPEGTSQPSGVIIDGDKMDRQERIAGIVLLAIVAIGLCVLLRPVTVSSDAMSPFFYAGDRVLAVTSHLGEGYYRREIVACSVPDEDGSCVRRIVGLPGDMVSTEKDKPSQRLGEGKYLVASEDGRDGIIIAEDDIIGQVRMQYWPLSDWGFVG